MSVDGVKVILRKKQKVRLLQPSVPGTLALPMAEHCCCSEQSDFYPEGAFSQETPGIFTRKKKNSNFHQKKDSKISLKKKKKRVGKLHCGRRIFSIRKCKAFRKCSFFSLLIPAGFLHTASAAHRPWAHPQGEPVAAPDVPNPLSEPCSPNALIFCIFDDIN